MEIDHEIVTQALDDHENERGFSKAEFTLTKRDYAWNPASTKRFICGPATVTYERYADGGVTAIVS